MWDVLSGLAKMTWDVMSGLTKTACGIVRGKKSSSGHHCMSGIYNFGHCGSLGKWRTDPRFVRDISQMP